MPNAAMDDRGRWILPAGLIVLAITALRLLLLVFNRMDLFVDEAQYWLWGRDLALGYYSKPPMIGWVIGLTTRLAGSDAAFWVRAPAPVLHGITAMILGHIGARLFGTRAGVLTASGFVTLPMVSLASILMSTDTVMFPFLALALAAYLHLLRGGSHGTALLAGLALGLAFLSKYAAIYYLICAVLAAIALPAARPRPGTALLILLAFAVAISPNLIWNAQNGFSTVEHTLDNANWVRDPGTRAGLNPGALVEFLVSQFAVFGPVLFGGLIWIAARFRYQSPDRKFLLIFALPVLAVVCVQALLSGAYANWAAATYLAGTVAVLPWLARGWRVGSFVINGALAVALPVLGVFGAAVILPGGQPALARYMGRADMSRALIDTARANNLDTIVAQNRDVLADLFYTGRDSDMRFFAVPVRGRAPNHYALKYPYPGGSGRVLFVSDTADPPACAAGTEALGRIAPQTGAYRGKPKTLFAIPAGCWAEG